jgi:protein-S-isoprenylcysteine O-methyltransferase Ste14
MKLNIILLAVTAVALAALTVFIVRGDRPWTPARIAGMAIALPSLVLFVTARLQLGSSFSIQAKAQKLVTTGVYARIRNPIYLFGGLLLAGLFLYFQPYLLLLFVVLVPMQILRARKEEQVLAAKFGEEYQRYKARTWF